MGQVKAVSEEEQESGDAEIGYRDRRSQNRRQVSIAVRSISAPPGANFGDQGLGSGTVEIGGIRLRISSACLNRIPSFGPPCSPAALRAS